MVVERDEWGTHEIRQNMKGLNLCAFGRRPPRQRHANVIDALLDDCLMLRLRVG